MSPPIQIPRDDPHFPLQLADLDPPLPEITLRGHLGNGPVVAIVGTRQPTPEAELFTTKLATRCAMAGVIVASGGAYGIDAAAHRGALEAGGTTWAVLPTGCDHIKPSKHGPLYDGIVEAGGALIWPFPPAVNAHYTTYFLRNRVLAAMADAVVVVQAGIPSGALNAAKHARDLGRPLWVVSPPAWDKRFAGSLQLLELGARPLTRIEKLLSSLGIGSSSPDTHTDIQPRKPTKRVPSSKHASVGHDGRVQLDLSTFQQGTFNVTNEAQAVFHIAESMPLHIDELIERAGLPAATVSTALLTLALENVLVEGPNGFFRRADACKHLSSLNFCLKDVRDDGEDARSRRIACQGEDDQEVPGGALRRSRIEGAR